MSQSRCITLPLAGAIALTLGGIAIPAVAKTPPPMQASATTSMQFLPGTQSSATYPLPDSHGGTLTVNAGMPAQARSFGPPPPFKTLDANHDGRISEAEARAYPPLDSDFLYASHGGTSISRTSYQSWVKDQR